ncbi:PD-(D/E)XK nuclease-like domain-containing protein [Salinimonas marina]|uniref:PD-(D/E)XK nuclease-like domain-containing protein n=1 Tax=Salinimonas marina TaxID=2785918 RepID=A0A7S9HDT4_9ALTE|nr:PD-(D/E)XK nuclease-like domain-containing protein [Salinimonas marina]QPG06530.1 PD-(D/E)XK nuclease-like domain-containing protein [Salinimonas marina]
MKASIIKGQITRLNKKLATLAPGETLIKENLHSDVYHCCTGVSTSKLKVFIECPRKYQALYLTGEMERKESKAFDIGKAAHGLILEPHKFESEFVVQPADIKLRRGKAWDAFVAENSQKTIITQDDWDHCFGMRDSVERHPFGAKLLAGGKAEVSYFKRDIETGLIVKCRPDMRVGNRVVDVKSAASASPEEFGRVAKRLMYHMQDALYLDVTGAEEFAFLAVEKEKPYVCTAPIVFDDESRRLGHLKYRKALHDLADAMTFNHFTGYSDQPVVLSLKPWELKELTDMEQAA